jgi:coenzyme PQQ synthesis protein D (PqqD)
MTPISSKRVYEVWTQVIQDEELYEAMLAGTHARLEGRQFDAEAIEILDRFHAEPGTPWNVENLRFRASQHVGDTLLSYMPRMMRMLTRGEEGWRQDLCYEYLAYHRWQALGHLQLSECERFVSFVRSRVMKRRVTPPHLETVIRYELAVVHLLRSTAEIPADAWPVHRKVSDEDLPAARPRRGPCQVMVELDVDLRPWIESGDPDRGEVGPGPITLLVHMPTLEDWHQIKAISDGARVVLERCDGNRTVDELEAELEAEYDLPAAGVRRLVRTLLDERILCA